MESNIKGKKQSAQRVESTIKSKKQKNRAKGINKSEPPRRAQKPIFSAYFCAYKYTIKAEKASRDYKKRQKRRFTLLCAYHRQRAAQYKCDTSVLCLYLLAPVSQYPHPLYLRIPLRCHFSIFVKKFFLKILALE